MFGQKGDNSDQPADGSNGSEIMGGHPPIASAATDPAASISDSSAWQHPGAPLSDQTNSDSEEPPKDVISPAGGYPSAPSGRIDTSGVPIPEEPVGDDAAAINDAADNLVTDADDTTAELVEIKQKALHELAPLIDELDLPPEDKFRTVMMMIQASDDQTLVEKAYEVAHSIENEHVRAQALLDIVNEINYFTQPPATADPAS
ncbi:MAG TPA: hypothetical protein VH234_00100 [Candidatus Saccharimonadales bacterium]|jgi:hypothetical protein|nr:hypothetical protein [Candidatus Saccharimonadales bacterium]